MNSNNSKWVLPNKKEFSEWFNEKYIKYRANGKIIEKTKKFIPYNYQKLLTSFMQNTSPYRGILLYHGLGTGKTCTSINIAENLKKERNIVVMLPASLQSNFIYKGLLYCGDEEYQKNIDKLYEKYSFISYNANNTLTQLRRLGTLDNKVIIIEEVHNLISKIISSINGQSKQGLEIYNMLINATNTKIIALSGTPVINDIFETGVLLNILNGYNEIIYFRIINTKLGIGIKEYDELEKDLMKYKYVDLVKINKINKSVELLLNIKSYDSNYVVAIDFILSKLNTIFEATLLENRKVPLFPIEDQGEQFKKYFVDENEKEGDNLKNPEIFKRRIMGLVSHYVTKKGNYPDVIMKDIYRIPMSNYQFQIYEILRRKERMSEKGKNAKNKKKNKKKQVKSTFRVFSRQASNFVFPEEILRPYPDPKFVVSIKKNNNDEKADKNFEKSVLLEERLNNNGKITEDYKKRITKALSKLEEKGEIYLRPGPNGLDKLSPKMKLILENIENCNGLIFIYSNFRSLEGIEILSQVLDFNGYAKYGSFGKEPKYAIYSGNEDEKIKKDILETFTSEENKYGKLIKIILATAAGAEGLDLQNIRQIHVIEPYWNQMRIQQVIGRGVRRDSHIKLLPSERNVEIYRYFSVFSKKDSILTKDKLSTDEHIEELSLKKQKIINELLLILKECSFDCTLNAADINSDYKCFNFGRGAKGLSYYPYISDDIIHSNVVENKRTIQKKLVKAVYYQSKVYLYNAKNKKFYLYSNNNKKSVDIDLKKSKPIYIDLVNNLVYDVKSIKMNNPIIIGKVNENKIIKI
mgnify:CR=1 FL=1|tara:strand:+ start:1585 stop:4005 length:2421 start_codon:yes stop_codon:yes gene_type:complete